MRSVYFIFFLSLPQSSWEENRLECVIDEQEVVISLTTTQIIDESVRGWRRIKKVEIMTAITNRILLKTFVSECKQSES